MVTFSDGFLARVREGMRKHSEFRKEYAKNKIEKSPESGDYSAIRKKANSDEVTSETYGHLVDAFDQPAKEMLKVGGSLNLTNDDDTYHFHYEQDTNRVQLHIMPPLMPSIK